MGHHTLYPPGVSAKIVVFRVLSDVRDSCTYSAIFFLCFGLLCTDSVNFLSNTGHCCLDSRDPLGGKVGGPHRRAQHFLKLATNANYVLFANARAFVHPSFQANNALYCTLSQPFHSRAFICGYVPNCSALHFTPLLLGLTSALGVAQ